MAAKRQQLYDAGVAALGRAMRLPPDQQGLYACPTCLALSAIDDTGPYELTIDHIPPRVLKRPWLEVLTCWTCNNSAGRFLDNEVQKRRVVESLEPGRPVRGRLTVGNLTVNADFKRGPSGPILEVNQLRNRPGANQEFVAAVKAGDGRMNFTGAGYRPRREAVGLLRIAYLAVFGALGYSAVLSPVFERIRAQIANPDDRVIPHTWRAKDKAKDSARQIWFVVSPLNCVGVQIDQDFVLLPIHGEPPLYEELERIGSAPLESKGAPMPLPARPLYQMDTPARPTRGSAG